MQLRNALAFLLCIVSCLAHVDHDHHHHDSMEDVKFRYSKRANEGVNQGSAASGHEHDNRHDHHYGQGHHHHGHDHSYDHGHNHHHHHHHHGHQNRGYGHSHDNHGHDHSHDNHGHDDSHDHEHGHSHDHHEHEHGHSHDHGHDHHHHGHQHHGHDHSHDRHGHDHGHGGCCSGSRTQGKQADDEIWKYALGSTLLISAAPFFILFFIPLQSNDEQYQPLLKVLLSFASGGLLGDAFLHLIPHAIEYQNHHGGNQHHHHHHGHDGEHHAHVHDLTIGLSVIGGFVLFLVIEKFVRLCNGSDHHGHSHGHGHQPAPPKNKEDKNSSDEKEDGKSVKANNDRDKLARGETKIKKAKVRDHNDEHASDIKVSGYLNLVADFTHNFTDGLTIATSYMLGMQVGIVSTVTILFHEVPHEIGDFSILIQSGFGKRKAILMQSFTAIGALSGTLVGLLAQGLGDEFINLYILPFTAGGFIYIATVSVIPELLEETKVSRTLIQLLAIFFGVYLMVVISWYE